MPTPGRGGHDRKVIHPVLGAPASIMGSELPHWPPTLRFAPVLCRRVILMYRLAAREIHKKYNTHRAMTTPSGSWLYRGGAMLNFALTASPKFA